MAGAVEVNVTFYLVETFISMSVQWLIFFQIYFKYISPTLYQKYIILFSKGVKIKYIYGININIFKYILSKIYFSNTLSIAIIIVIVNVPYL